MRKVFNKNIIKKLDLYLGILLAFFLLLSYLAPFINPAKLLFPAYFGLAYPYFLLANFIFLIYWAIRMKKEILIPLLAILLGWGHLMNFMPIRLGGLKKEKTETEQQIKIMSYNIRTFNLNNWEKTTDPRDGIYEIIGNEDPDIVCLQEFYTSHRSGRREEDVSRNLYKYKYHKAHYLAKDEGEAGFGIVTYSKYPIVYSSRIPFAKSMNLALYTDMIVLGDTVRVFNIHLQSIRLDKDKYSLIDSVNIKSGNKYFREVQDISHRLNSAFVQRSVQAKIVHNYIKESPYPVIVCGDFNDTPVSYAYRKIKTGLRDAFRKQGKGFGNTYAGEMPSFRIDYILYSKSLNAIDYKRIKTRYTDHFPITSILEFKD